MKFVANIVGCLFVCVLSIHAQDPAGYVDPFIGTNKSDSKTVWGQYGGTYPGAVAPWGFVQLSPETSKKGEHGYFYNDSTICYFTCTNHSSGYPEGSHGSIRVVFSSGDTHTKVNKIEQDFSHINEQAHPGYYAVKFDDGSLVEATASAHTGIFRYRPAKVPFIVSIAADAGSIEVVNDSTIVVDKNNGIFICHSPWKKHTLESGMLVLEFDHMPDSGKLLVKTGFSMVDTLGSRKNMNAECPGWDFDTMKEKTYDDWNKELSVVRVSSGDTLDYKKFYTALYHSFLLPDIISDVDGRYRGADRQIHQTTRAHEYGKFSPWDTFRSLHPLLSLLKPQRQLDMLYSMLDVYDQQGNLPYKPMIGYYALPIFTDSYVKGITAFDTVKAYKAMRKCLLGNEIPRKDTYRYIADGFLNDSIDESVSITLDYAYNDWALATFADITGHTADASLLRERSFNYRNLFDPETRFMLPRNHNGFVRSPGEMGYKEANKWTASWFVPHNVQDLINLSGGDLLFTEHLQKAMESGYIVHDNEPVLHYPYLFSYAGRPDLTCSWVDHIRENCYTQTSGGIPGNDDLGSMSSWFVLSAMGFYPVCPGRPEYVLTTPLFPSVTILLDNGHSMEIKTDAALMHRPFSNLELNGRSYDKLFISHEQILAGGVLHFVSDSRKDFSGFVRPSSLTTGLPNFHVKDVRLSNKKGRPHQETQVRFTVENTGATGAYPAILEDNGESIVTKLIPVNQGSTVTDSLPFRLYPQGKHQLSLSRMAFAMKVHPSRKKMTALVCTNLASTPLVRMGEKTNVRFELQNVSGKLVAGSIPLYANDSIISQISYKLKPGEKLTGNEDIVLNNPVFYDIMLLDQVQRAKVYDTPMESCVLDVDFDHPDNMFIHDNSGFDNHGIINGPVAWTENGDYKALQVDSNSYITFPLSESLNITGKTITLSVWVYPMNRSKDYIDFFTKGDYTVLKTSGSSLSFFAGGWGRGKCSVTLPSDWLNNWHHVAGVCNGKELKVYIDGKIRQSLPVEGEMEQTDVAWNLGRNAEMPYSRRYEGLFGNVKIFKDALSDEDIEELFKQKDQ